MAFLLLTIVGGQDPHLVGNAGGACRARAFASLAAPSPEPENRAEVRKIQCLFNLRQVALVLKLYIADHDQQFPWNYDGLAGQRLMPN
jgi:hypothetical protein